MTAGVTVTADGFEQALIGSFLQPAGPMLAVYSLNRVMDILENDGLSAEAATDWINENLLGAYCGPGTPLYIDDRWNRWGRVRRSGPLEPPMLETG